MDVTALLLEGVDVTALSLLCTLTSEGVDVTALHSTALHSALTSEGVDVTALHLRQTL